MSLSTIRAEVAADLGIRIESATQKSFLDDKINKAAEEIYEKYDLRNSLREQIFMCDNAQQLITVPYYVYRTRKIRSYDFLLGVKNVDMRPRYSYSEWMPPFLNWRIVREFFPLSRDIENEGPLTFVLSEPATAVFSITIVGKTGTAEKTTEVIVFSVGDEERSSTKNWAGSPEMVIAKNRVIDQDITIEDMDGNEVSSIPNSELKPSFTLVQVLERYQQFGENPLYEVLYKTRFTPFKNDADEFPCGSVYDRAIYWKTIEHLASKQDGDEAMKRVIGASAKCDQVIKQNEQNSADGQVKPLSFAPCQYFNLFRTHTFKSNQIFDDFPFLANQ